MWRHVWHYKQPEPYIDIDSTVLTLTFLTKSTAFLCWPMFLPTTSFFSANINQSQRQCIHRHSYWCQNQHLSLCMMIPHSSNTALKRSKFLFFQKFWVLRFKCLYSSSSIRQNVEMIDVCRKKEGGIPSCNLDWSLQKVETVEYKHSLHLKPLAVLTGTKNDISSAPQKIENTWYNHKYKMWM